MELKGTVEPSNLLKAKFEQLRSKQKAIMAGDNTKEMVETFNNLMATLEGIMVYFSQHDPEAYKIAVRTLHSTTNHFPVH